MFVFEFSYLIMKETKKRKCNCFSKSVTGCLEQLHRRLLKGVLTKSGKTINEKGIKITEPVFNVGFVGLIRTPTCQLCIEPHIYGSLSSSSENQFFLFLLQCRSRLLSIRFWSRSSSGYKGDPISITPSSLSGFKDDSDLFHRRSMVRAASSAGVAAASTGRFEPPLSPLRLVSV